MDDETLIEGVNGSSQEPLPETNGSETQPVAEQAQTPPPQEYLSRQDLERWQADIDAKWQARLQEVERKAQAKADKARDTAIRKAKDFDTYAASMKAAGIELDPEQIASVKNAVINQQFWSEEEPVQATLQAAAGQIPVTDTVSRDELVNAIRAQGLSENDVDLTKYVGASRYDSQTEQDFLDDVAIARAKAAEAKRQAKINKQQAQVAGQVKQEFGTLSSPATGAPKAGYDPVAELEKMNKQDPPSDPAAYRKWQTRYQQMYAEASKRLGN